MISKPAGTEGLEQLILRRFDGKRFFDDLGDVVREMLLDVVVNGNPVVTIACAGIHLKELTTGFLKQEGLIESAGDILDMVFSSERVDVHTPDVAGVPPSTAPTRTIASSGARGSRTLSQEGGNKPLGPTGPKLDAQAVLRLMDALLAATAIHERTRGTHCSALATAQDILAAREDIGRHNTIDMLCGWALLEAVDLSDKILLTTGRVSSEIVSKARRMGIPVIISHSAATSRAVVLAEKLGIVVVGYVRGGSFTVYAGSKAIKD
jgi:FdhD protein